MQKILIAEDDGELREHGIRLHGNITQGAHGKAAGVGLELHIRHAQVRMAMDAIGRERGRRHSGAPPAFITHHLFGGYFGAILPCIK